ncbi:hypothetical protein FRB90_005640, partial [Tulasnella sp. 427]
IQGYDASQIANSELLNGVRSLKNIQPESLRIQVIGAYAKSISSIWLICTPLVALGMVLSFFVRAYTLKRGVVREQKKGNSDEDGRVETHESQDRDLERAEPRNGSNPNEEANREEELGDSEPLSTPLDRQRENVGSVPRDAS